VAFRQGKRSCPARHEAAYKGQDNTTVEAVCYECTYCADALSPYDTTWSPNSSTLRMATVSHSYIHLISHGDLLGSGAEVNPWPPADKEGMTEQMTAPRGGE
jgi:hypothetical protein